MELHARLGRFGVDLYVERDDPEAVPGLAGLESAEQMAAVVGDAWADPVIRDAAADARRAIKALQAALAETAEA